MVECVVTIQKLRLKSPSDPWWLASLALDMWHPVVHGVYFNGTEPSLNVFERNEFGEAPIQPLRR